MKKRIKRLQGSSYVVSLEPADVLGQGSFGKVVRAYDMENRDEQLVAKIMEIGTHSKMQSLKQELEILETFQSDHQNLVKYKRYTLMSSKACYIIMEYCNGGTLEDKIIKPLSETEVFNFLSQFCGGYKELYYQGIVHRDLKPANIMIHDRLYKITDFGLAKVMTEMNHPMAISFKGTPLYMAPEMIKEEAADSKIDMWSLGIIVYRMLFNKFPFLVAHKKYDRESAFEDIVKNPLIVSGKRSEAMVQLLKGMLEKDPKKRISWEQLFKHPLIANNQSPEQQEQQKLMMTSSLFIQQMVTQKISMIKVQPFKPKISFKLMDTQDFMQQVQSEEDQQKFILDDMITNLNEKLQISKAIKLTEDKLLYIREQVFWIDNTSLRTSRLRINKDLENNIILNLLDHAMLLLCSLKNLSILSEEQQNIFKKSDNYKIFEQLIIQDQQGISEFKDDIKQSLTEKITNPGKKYLQLIKTEKKYSKQIYIVVQYLLDLEDVDRLGFKSSEDFWTYYEDVENHTEEEAIQHLKTLL